MPPDESDELRFNLEGEGSSQQSFQKTQAQLMREEREHQHLLELIHTARLTAISELATEIAHEINQPLTAISNYSTACLCAVQSGQTSDTLAVWLENIKVQAKRASQIVYRLRAFIGKEQFSYDSIDIAELIREVIGFTEIEARAHGIKIKANKAGRACRAIANKILIEQVLFNLIRNAIEALAGMDPSDRSERQLWIHTEQEADKVILSVRDNGPGIPS